MLKRRASATWQGGLQTGTGQLSGTSGVLNNTPYSFKTRFTNEDGAAGTNPEELLAAAHAGCFAMAVCATLEKEGFTADRADVKAVLTMDTATLSITAVELTLDATVPNITNEQFQGIAEGAKKMCVISRALNPDITITLTATLV